MGNLCNLCYTGYLWGRYMENIYVAEVRGKLA